MFLEVNLTTRPEFGEVAEGMVQVTNKIYHCFDYTLHIDELLALLVVLLAIFFLENDPPCNQ
jgi:hypothetical protein